MKKIIVCLTATVCFVMGHVNAQNCPTISVSSPMSVIDGDKLVFVANVSGGNPNASFTYNWSVSAGFIESGQGTAVITVNTKELGGQTITATVELGNLPPACSRTSSSTTSIDVLPPKTELLSKGNYTTAKLFAADVNAFAGVFLSAYYITVYPEAIIYLYPGKTATAGAALKEMTKNIKTVFAKNGIINYRIITGGKRAQTSYEMWIVPTGEKVPVATPAH